MPDPGAGETISGGGRGERFFDQLFERSPVAMQIFSPDGTLLRTNEAFRRLLGFPRLDTGVGRFNILNDPFSMRAGSPERFRRALAGETVEHRDQSFDVSELLPQKDPARSRIYCDSSFFPVCTETGEVEAVVLMLWDTSDRKKAELAQSEFISVLSHELRTPLTSIRGSLCLLAAGVPESLPPVPCSMVDIAVRNSERLLILINDLLDIQQIASGGLEMRLRKILVEPLLLQALEENMGLATALGVSFSLVRTDTEVRVMADPVRFLQLMTNLLSNAAKFSPPDGVVEVALERENGHARISVRDRGPGIPEEFRPRVFTSFAQADTSNTRARGGTGLGLCIAKTLAEGMGGSIGYRSEAGEGTTFHVLLPVLAAADPVAG